MLIKILFNLILIGLIIYGYVYLIQRIAKLNKRIKDLDYTEFSIDTIKPEMYKLVKFLKNKKTRLTSYDKIEIYTQWNKILLLLPLDYHSYIYNEYTEEEISKNAMSTSERKRLIIDLIEDLLFNYTLDKDIMKKISFHIYFIMT